MKMDAIQTGRDNASLIQADLDKILSELDHYRCQSDRLQKVNDLYRKLARITNLPTMIESYSIWLSQYVPHEIIGYNNLTRQCMHMFCSCHGPHRRQVINITEKLLKQDDNTLDRHRVVEGFHCHKWSFQSSENAGALVLLRKDRKIPRDEIDLINVSLTILAEPLTKTHDYEEIFKQARRDSLTGLPNRYLLDQVLARGDLWNDPAENCVRVLGKDDVSGDATLRYHGSGRLVARRLDPEDGPAPEAHASRTFRSDRYLFWTRRCRHESPRAQLHHDGRQAGPGWHGIHLYGRP